jgi:hypothetical protein
MTEAETRKALSQFDRYLFHGQERILDHPAAIRDSYWIENYPLWATRVAQYLPTWAYQHILFVPYSSFSVSPRFQSGQLVLLEVRETQEHKGDMHPYAASVRLLSTGTEQGNPELPHDFTGFQVSPIQEVYEDGKGNQIGPSWISREYVTLDERASSEQRAHSFEFHLDCFTSLKGCRDARQILPIGQ